jgi:uncharacterized protein (TIGR02246 family)
MCARLIIIATLALWLGSCSPAPPPDFDQSDTDRINTLIQDFITVYNAKDDAKVAALFSETGAVMPPNASTTRGIENVRVHYMKRFSQGASGLSLETAEVVGAGTIAYVTGDYRLTMAPSDGPERRDRGKFIFILRERGGRWLLERLMFSSDFAPEPAG